VLLAGKDERSAGGVLRRPEGADVRVAVVGGAHADGDLVEPPKEGLVVASASVPTWSNGALRGCRSHEMPARRRCKQP